MLYVEVSPDTHLVDKEIKSLRNVIAKIEKDTGHKVNFFIKKALPFVAEHDPEMVTATRLLITAVSMVDPNRHSIVRMGGCMGSAIDKGHDKLSKLMLALTSITKWKPVPLAFPLKQSSTLEVMLMLAPDTVKLTWSCELPGLEACGVCASCKSIKQAYGEYYRKNGTNLR